MTYPPPPPYLSEPSGQSAARQYLRRATELAKDLDASPAALALLYASLAQAEASIEVADLLRAGIPLRHAEELTMALNHLARRLPDR